MDIKIKKIGAKFSFKKIMLFLNIFLIIVFLSLFLFLGVFLKSNVYEVISAEDQEVIDKEIAGSLVLNLNIEKFKTIINNIENKKIPRQIQNFKDIFN